MDQNITLKIGGKDFHLKVQSPEMEQLMRLATEDVNARLANYTQMYPDKSAEDKLALVCLNEAINMLALKRNYGSLKEEIEGLTSQTGAYLSEIEK